MRCPAGPGEDLDLLQLLPEQHFTQPPPRFTEASLVKALEEKGIGRPSTYAPTIATIQARGYVVTEEKKLVATELGLIVNDLLVEHFPRVFDVGFTSQMEEELDEIAAGDRAWVPTLHEFYGPFVETLAEPSRRWSEFGSKMNRPGKTVSSVAARWSSS